MFAKQVMLLIFYGLIIIALFPMCSTASEPNFRVVGCTDSTRIDPGENLTIYVYIIGVGNTTDNFILVYFNSDIIVTDAKFMGESLEEGIADRGTNVQLLRWNISIPDNIEEINPFHPLHIFWARSETSLPFTFEVLTSQNTPSGEHDLKIIYQYKEEDGTWHSTSDILTFHITTDAEQIEYETLKLSLTEPYLAALLGFLSGLGVYFLGLIISRIIEKKKQKKSHEQLLGFIRQEIESNRTKAKNLHKVSANALPQNRMEISNKDAVWPRIIIYPKRDLDLINQISYLYDKYGLLNRTIDSGFAFAAQQKMKIPSGFSTEIQRICNVIDKNSDKIIRRINELSTK